jgi:hypothetical protein
MTSINNHKRATVLLAIAALAGMVAIGSIHNALADKTVTITTRVNNTGVNVPTDTYQKQDCLTAGGSSGITNSCTASSTDTITQSGGILKK